VAVCGREGAPSGLCVGMGRGKEVWRQKDPMGSSGSEGRGEMRGE
jgi:hypothetical protein